MAVNGANINAAAVNATGDRTFTVITGGFSATTLDGVYVFRDLDLVADFYRPPDVDYVKAREIEEIVRPVPKDEP